MIVTVVWDTWLKSGAETEGLRLTRQVWADMRSFDGYLSHQIFIDQDAPGHIIALAQWQSRANAEAVRDKYKDSDTIRQLTSLLARPRERWGCAKMNQHQSNWMPRRRGEHTVAHRTMNGELNCGNGH